jgi:hypothetical protein
MPIHGTWTLSADLQTSKGTSLLAVAPIKDHGALLQASGGGDPAAEAAPAEESDDEVGQHWGSTSSALLQP